MQSVAQASAWWVGTRLDPYAGAKTSLIEPVEPIHVYETDQN